MNDLRIIHRARSKAALLLLAGVTIAHAQIPAPPPAVVNVSASASAPAAFDRMKAMLRAEAERATASEAAAEVNRLMSTALAHVKGASGVNATTSSYSTYQTYEQGKPSRWRVSQGLSLEGGDFIALAALVSKLQDEDKLLVSGIDFAVSADARAKIEDRVASEAIASWRRRAQQAAQGLGYERWRPGHVSVQTGEMARPQPLMKAQAMSASAAPAPISVEAGTTEVTVTVSGEAVLEGARP